MSSFNKPDYIVVTKEFDDAIDKLEGRVQIKNMKKILRTTAKKVYMQPLKSNSPSKSGKLRRSFGTVTGKSRYQATMFIGPRVPRGYRNMSDEEKAATKYGGWVANILEYAKPGRRFPKNATVLKTPWGYRKSVGPIRKRTRFRAIMQSLSRKALDTNASELKKLLWQ